MRERTTRQGSRQRRGVPVWPVGALAALIIVAVAAAVLANRGENGSSTVTVEDAKSQEWRVNILATPDEVQAGRMVRVKVSVTNTSERIQGLTFPDGQQLQLTAQDEGGRVVWRAEASPQRFLLTRSVTGGSPVDYSYSWPTKDIEPGEYKLRASVLSEELKGRAMVETSVALR